MVSFLFGLVVGLALLAFIFFAVLYIPQLNRKVHRSPLDPFDDDRAPFMTFYIAGVLLVILLTLIYSDGSYFILAVFSALLWPIMLVAVAFGKDLGGDEGFIYLGVAIAWLIAFLKHRYVKW